MVHLRVDVHRLGAAEHQRVDDAAVDVPGQNDLFPLFAGGQHHALHCGGGSVHHEKGVFSAEGLSGQLLSLLDDGNRVAQVVQGLHGIYIHAHALFSQKGGKLRRSLAPLMPGHVEGDDAHPLKAL